MGLPVTVYRYTDAGAPQITSGTPSEWVNVLKKVLVEGYGSKAPLGWTLEFENAGARKVAFRNSLTDSGTGGYFQFWSSDGSDTAGRVCYIKNAGSMSSLDTFTKPGWTRAFPLSTSGKGWEIIGTSRGFFLIQHRTVAPMVMNSSTNAQQLCCFIGDIESFIPNDIGIFVIVTGNPSNSDNTSTSVSNINIASCAPSMWCKMFAADGSDTYGYYSATPFVENSTSNAFISNAEVSGFQHILLPMIFTLPVNTANNDSTVLPTSKGKCPGLLKSSFAGYSNDVWPVTANINGINHVLLRGYNAPSYWVSTGDWYE